MKDILKKLAVLAPAVPTVFVAGCIGVSLQGYTAPVYAAKAPEVSEEEKEEVPVASDAEDAEKKTAAGSFDMEDGVYEGTGTGFAGKITVSVEIKDKKIIAINILSVEADDSAFFNRAKGVIDKIIEGQTLDVDVVSGATYSSRGIISAVKNALTGEADNQEPASSGGAASAEGASKTVSQVQDAAAYKDGTYYGTGTGFGGPLTVKVDISGGKIVSIEITQTSDGSSYIQKASGLISSIISSQSTNVDTVSGATYSSVGIIEAVRDALRQAAVSSAGSDVQQSGSGSNAGSQSGTEQSGITGTIPYKDGIYYGTGEGFQGDIKVAVVIQDKTIKTILIMESEDDEAFFNRAKAVAENIVKKQSTNVDLVSGATYSSRGIQNAVINALKEAEKVTKGENTEEKPPEETPIPEGKFPYNEGVYFGTGEGYLGDVKVAVSIQDNTIKAIVVTESEDDEEFFHRARKVMNDVVEKQSTDVDTVSGATFSSKGILEAIENALIEAEKITNGEVPDDDHSGDDETLGGDDNPGENDNPGGEDDSNGGDDDQNLIYVNGSYSAQALCVPDEDEDFAAYNLSLRITVENDRIIGVTAITGDGDKNNDSYIKRAANGTSKLPGVVNQILETGTPDNIDTVSMATCSSKAIIEACAQALEYARR